MNFSSGHSEAFLKDGWCFAISGVKAQSCPAPINPAAGSFRCDLNGPNFEMEARISCSTVTEGYRLGAASGIAIGKKMPKQKSGPVLCGGLEGCVSNATLPLNLKCNWLSQFLLQMTRSGVLEAGTSNVLLAGRSRYLNCALFFRPVPQD